MMIPPGNRHCNREHRIRFIGNNRQAHSSNAAGLRLGTENIRSYACKYFVTTATTKRSVDRQRLPLYEEWGGQMKKTYEALAMLFRWFVVGTILFIITLPILVSLEIDS